MFVSWGVSSKFFVDNFYPANLLRHQGLNRTDVSGLKTDRKLPEFPFHEARGLSRSIVLIEMFNQKRGRFFVPKIRILSFLAPHALRDEVDVSAVVDEGHQHLHVGLLVFPGLPVLSETLQELQVETLAEFILTVQDSGILSIPGVAGSLHHAVLHSTRDIGVLGAIIGAVSRGEGRLVVGGPGVGCWDSALSGGLGFVVLLVFVEEALREFD